MHLILQMSFLIKGLMLIKKLNIQIDLESQVKNV